MVYKRFRTYQSRLSYYNFLSSNTVLRFRPKTVRFSMHRTFLQQTSPQMRWVPLPVRQNRVDASLKQRLAVHHLPESAVHVPRPRANVHRSSSAYAVVQFQHANRYLERCSLPCTCATVVRRTTCPPSRRARCCTQRTKSAPLLLHPWLPDG